MHQCTTMRTLLCWCAFEKLVVVYCTHAYAHCKVLPWWKNFDVTQVFKRCFLFVCTASPVHSSRRILLAPYPVVYQVFFTHLIPTILTSLIILCFKFAPHQVACCIKPCARMFIWPKDGLLNCSVISHCVEAKHRVCMYWCVCVCVRACVHSGVI